MIRFKRLDDRAAEPKRGTSGSAGIDIAALDGVVIPPRGRAFVRTGWAMEIPIGFVGVCYSRSGHAKVGVRLANCAGVLDADFRGEIGAIIANDSDAPVAIARGERIMQIVVTVAAMNAIEIVDELTPTARGAGGWGSTGK